jgi:starch-binding outer membrane protein, SusD/RagB family
MKKTVIFLMLLIFASITACTDILNVSSQDCIDQTEIWTTEEYADKAVVGIYGVFYNSDLTEIAAGSAGGIMKQGIEALGFCTAYMNTCNLLTNQTPNASDSYISKEWKFGFEGVSRCNDVIANLYKAPLSEGKYKRLLAETKFLRAFFYYRLNELFQGVPIYLEPVTNDECTKTQSSADSVWQVCINDLTDVIDEPNVADNNLTSLYGRPSRGAAYALRGMIYLWQKKYKPALSDFENVEKCGYSLFNGSYKDQFTYANEKNTEMIFPLQYSDAVGYYDNIQKMVGGRDNLDSWDELQPSYEFVNSFQNADGSDFSWDDHFTGFSNMTAIVKEMFFLRDSLKSSTKSECKAFWADLDNRGASSLVKKRYLDVGNEARLKSCYDNRDPRLKQIVVTPYEPYNCQSDWVNDAKIMNNKQLRYPYLNRGTDNGDLWPDKRGSFYYLYRKYNEMTNEIIINREKCHNDYPLIRLTDIVLRRAECLIALGDLDGAIEQTNRIRVRAGMPALTNGGDGPNAVRDSADMMKRIRYESRIELCLEGVDFFNEVRWGTWNDAKFGGGYKNMWGAITNGNWYKNPDKWPWSCPTKEIQKNLNLKRRDGWSY